MSVTDDAVRASIRAETGRLGEVAWRGGSNRGAGERPGSGPRG